MSRWCGGVFNQGRTAESPDVGTSVGRDTPSMGLLGMDGALAPRRPRMEEGVMPISWFPRRGISRRLLIAALAALLAFATMVVVPGSAAHGQVAPPDDPVDTCGVDVLFVLDASGSMGDNGNEGINAVRAGVLAFLAELETEAPASTVALMRFGTLAGDTLDYTAVGDDALETWMNNTYAAYSSPAYWTNWDSALGTAASAFSAATDVILITDGNPTTSGDGSVREDTVASWNANTTAAIPSANALKAKTTDTVFGIGAGVPLRVRPANGRVLRPPGRPHLPVVHGAGLLHIPAVRRCDTRRRRSELAGADRPA